MDNRIHSLRRALGLTQQQLADAAGVDKSTIWRYEKGITSPFNSNIHDIAQALHTSAEGLLLALPTARLIGYVGAGAVVHSDEDDGERIPAPPGMDEPCALRVIGTSMMPAYRPGDILFCEDRATNSSDILNHDCVVETLDGRRLVKKVLPGGAPDSVRLFGYETQEAEPDVRLRSAAIVRWVQRA